MEMQKIKSDYKYSYELEKWQKKAARESAARFVAENPNKKHTLLYRASLSVLGLTIKDIS